MPHIMAYLFVVSKMIYFVLGHATIYVLQSSFDRVLLYHGLISPLDAHMNAILYMDILRNELLPFARQYFWDHF